MTYFIPLDLRIDPVEKEHFVRKHIPELKKKYANSGQGLANVGNVTKLFPKTIAQTNQYVDSLGLTTRAVTLFAGDANTASWVIHADGVYYNDKPALLEARLSYYELAESPGIIRWWDNLPMVMQELPATAHSAARLNVMAECAELLRDRYIGWDELPPVTFEAETSVASAILRTDHAHHVIQGSGLRITISCQLVFADGNPHGVWEHIKNNIMVLGV